MPENQDINKLAAHLFREESGKMAAVLSKIFGLHDIDRIMDIVHDTFESALIKWKYSGIPDSPSAWLMQVAKNKAINMLKYNRRETLLDPSELSAQNNHQSAEQINLDHYFHPHEIEDSQLRLLFTCCHPEFPEKNQIILTLHILSGFRVKEISNALLMNYEAAKKALTRAKAQLKEKGNILSTSLFLQLDNRIETVLSVLYLMFNEGYKTTNSTSVINHDLCYESIRLTKLLVKKGMLKNESSALLSLMFFNLSRIPARITQTNEIITLAEQDRNKWDHVFMAEGHFYLKESRETASKQLSKYYLEALISSIHCSAKSFSETDWKTIVFLYQQLEKINPSPMVTLNRIIAQSYLNTSFNWIKEIEHLKTESTLKNHYLLYAAEGDMFKRMGELNQAKKAFYDAYELSTSQLDKQFLKRKIEECETIKNN